MPYILHLSSYFPRLSIVLPHNHPSSLNRKGFEGLVRPYDKHEKIRLRKSYTHYPFPDPSASLPLSSCGFIVYVLVVYFSIIPNDHRLICDSRLDRGWGIRSFNIINVSEWIISTYMG